MNSIEQVENLVRFALTSGIGSATVNRLLRHFGNSSAILAASEKELKEVGNIRTQQIRAILEAQETNPRLEMEIAEESGVRLIPYDDPQFPAPLLESNDPPYLLYVKGQLLPRDNQAIGIVGTRAASRYGRDQAERFAAGLAVSGFTIISGLARGIDTFAHRGALAAKGRTIAVVGCGLNHVYPPENRDLFSEIPLHGAVISEFTMDTAPGRDTFPRRNRIIAGMSQGLLVVEAPERSGSLITARQAIEMGREIFAIPGRIDQENTSGCHKLIREGACLVCNPSDILNQIPAIPPTTAPVSKQSALFDDKKTDPSDLPAATNIQADTATKISNISKEEIVLSVLTTEPEHIDNISSRLEMGIGEIAATLMILELKGLVTQSTGKYFSRKG